MTSEPVASRLVTWVLILLGAAEIPWVVYLAFTQERVVQAYHMKLAAMGLGGFSVGLCAATAWAVHRRSSWTPALAVAAATTMAFLTTMGRLSLSFDTSDLVGIELSPVIVTLPGIVAAVHVAWASLQGPSRAPTGPGPSPRSTGVRVAAVVLTATAVVLAVRVVLHVLQWDSTTLATHSRAIVVLLDTLQVVGLLGSGLASLTGRVRGTLVLASVAASLLICDAYGNVVMAASGQALNAALLYLVVGELPSILFCTMAIRAAHGRMVGAGGPAQLAGH